MLNSITLFFELGRNLEYFAVNLPRELYDILFLIKVMAFIALEGITSPNFKIQNQKGDRLLLATIL